MKIEDIPNWLKLMADQNPVIRDSIQRSFMKTDPGSIEDVLIQVLTSVQLHSNNQNNTVLKWIRTLQPKGMLPNLDRSWDKPPVSHQTHRDKRSMAEEVVDKLIPQFNEFLHSYVCVMYSIPYPLVLTVGHRERMIQDVEAMLITDDELKQQEMRT